MAVDETALELLFRREMAALPGGPLPFQGVRLTMRIAQRSNAAIAAGVLSLAAALGTSTFAADYRVDWAMDADPRIELPEPSTVFSDKLLPLWLQALSRPEADTRRLAAEAIARAKRLGMQGLETAVGPLEEALKAAGDEPELVMSCAQALVAVDARQAASALAERLEGGGVDLARIVEPALAAWDYEPRRAVWLARLSEARASRSRTILAIRALGFIREPRAAQGLRQLVADETLPVGLRLEAAGALGQIVENGLAETAAQLAKDHGQQGSPAGTSKKLMAVRMLARDSGAHAQSLLAELAIVDEPAVAAAAAGRLFEIDPDRVVALAERLLASPDAGARSVAARALVTRPTDAAITRLIPVLDDPHPDVRGFVASSLARLADQEPLHSAIFAGVITGLAGEGWRSLEQAAWLAGTLDHEPAADRLVELLSHPRPEVLVTAAWALRKLAMPQTLPAMLSVATRRSGEAFTAGVDEQVALLFEAFGLMRYREAEPLMMSYIPLVEGKLKSRPAATWAVGLLHEGQNQPQLTTLLRQRIEDAAAFPPVEKIDVRRMAAVTLARTRATEALPTVQTMAVKFADQPYTRAITNWALRELTGLEQPAVEVPPITPGGFFLQPLEN